MVIRGWWLRATSLNMQWLYKAIGWLLVFVAVFLFGLFAGKGHYWTAGFKAAYFAHKCGCLECEVQRNFPEWLTDGK